MAIERSILLTRAAAVASFNWLLGLRVAQNKAQQNRHLHPLSAPTTLLYNTIQPFRIDRDVAIRREFSP